MRDLLAEVDHKNAQCLNSTEQHPLSHCISAGVREDDAVYVESDVDAELLITLPFTEPVRIHSLSFRGPRDQGPRQVKLFVNNENMGFDEAESAAGVQTLELSGEQLDGRLVPLRFVKFQRVQSLTLFIDENMDDADTTVVSCIRVYGEPLLSTKMDGLKKAG